MKISQYLNRFLRDFLVACGCLMVIITILFSIHPTVTINTSPFWQIIVIALSFTFYKFALLNKYESGEKSQLISFSICFFLASMMIILWLWFFCPGVDKNLLLSYIFVIVIIKGLVYAMMYSDGNKQAKLVNEKLRQYKKGESE